MSRNNTGYFSTKDVTAHDIESNCKTDPKTSPSNLDLNMMK